MKGMMIMLWVMLLGIVVAMFWGSFPAVKEGVHFVLDPSLGALLDWNVTFGLLIITAVLNLITTILHKHMTDQNLLKSIKDEQKIVQEEMKLCRSTNPEKSLALSKKSAELAMKSMPIAMKPVLYTTIPFILLVRWFGDYFAENPVKIFGVMSGIWAYILFFVVFSMAFRKILKVH